jgi:hypothetical protein
LGADERTDAADRPRSRYLRHHQTATSGSVSAGLSPASSPILQPGEHPVVATRAMVGKFSSGRLGATVGQAMILEGGGLVGAALVSTRKQFVVLTNRRLIFLAQAFMGGPGKKVLGEVPREHVSLAEVKMGIVSLLRVGFGASGDGVALTFPRVDTKNAESLAEALQQASRA